MENLIKVTADEFYTFIWYKDVVSSVTINDGVYISEYKIRHGKKVGETRAYYDNGKFIKEYYLVNNKN